MDPRAQLADLHQQSTAILDCAEAADHRDLTENEVAELTRLSAEFDRMQAKLDVQDRGEVVRGFSGTGRRTVPDALDSGTGTASGGNWGRPAGKGAQMVASLFPDTARAGETGGYDMRGFFKAALSGRYDPRLEIFAAQNESVGSEGGFMVPQGLGRDLLGMVFEASPLLPLVRRIPLTTMSTVFPRFQFEDRSVSLLGGFTGVWTAEAAPGSVQTGKIVAITARAHKALIHSRASSELLADSAMFEAEFIPALVRALSYTLDRVIVRGTGAGQPLGLLNDPAMLVQAAEGSQVADTFVWANAVKMYSSLYAGGAQRAVWIVHPTVIPAILTMQNVVRNQAGTDNVGGVAAVTVGDGGQMLLLGRPIIQSEHMKILGDLGDVLLADLSQYALFMRSQIGVEVSNAPAWMTDEISYRASVRCDGMGLWTSAAKRPGDTNPSESWAVTLAAR